MPMPPGGQQVGVDLHPDRLLLLAEDDHLGHAADRATAAGRGTSRRIRSPRRAAACPTAGPGSGSAKSAGFTFRNDGGVGMSGGSDRAALEMADCTSRAAASMSRSRLNCRVIDVVPRALVERQSCPARGWW